MAKKRDVVGRKIVDVEWNWFETGRGSKKSTDPTIILDNGSRVHFVVIETEVGEYGIEMVVHKAEAKKE